MRDFKLSRLLRLALLPALAAGVSLSAPAQTATTDKTTAATATSATANNAYRGLRASQVIGMSVRNAKGENLGQISDMIVDMNSGDVRYAILQFDPGIFQGERLFAVPTTQLRMAADRDDMVYNVDKDRLERAAMKRSDWDRAWRDPAYLSNLDRIWGIAQPTRAASAHRVSDLIGKDVNNRQGSKIGEIEELVINMATQKVHYALLEFHPSWAAPEKFYAFPLRAFNLTADRDELTLDVDKSKIQAMKAFPASRFGSIDDPAWVADVDRYFVTVLPTVVATRPARTDTTRPSSTQVSQANQAGPMDRSTTMGQADTSRMAAGDAIRTPRADRN